MMKSYMFILSILSSLLFIACSDDCKEAKCNPHPELDLSILVDDKCECSCRKINEYIYNFNGLDYCLSPEKEGEMMFLSSMLDIGLHELDCNESMEYVVGVRIFTDPDDVNSLKYAIGSFPASIHANGDLLFDASAGNYTFDGGLGHGVNLMWSGYNCPSSSRNFRASGYINPDQTQFHMTMTIFDKDDLEGLWNNENPIATYESTFERMILQ